MRKQEEEALNGNLTAMIDVVFQLIIFFVCTVDMQEKSIDERVKLALAPHGQAVEKKDPREINIDIDGEGLITITRTPISQATLVSMLKKVVGEYGQDVPVVIRGDGVTQHQYVKTVMDSCAMAGIWKIKFAAIKEKNS